jgi:hypothetical protein
MNDKELIDSIISILPHMYQHDGEHNAKVLLYEYRNGILTSGVIFDHIKEQIDHEYVLMWLKENELNPSDRPNFEELYGEMDTYENGISKTIFIRGCEAYFNQQTDKK